MQTTGKKVRQLALCGGVALGAFLIACSGIQQILPRRVIPDLTRKLDWLAAHQSDYDTLFIGSSHVFVQIDPATFDAEMARLGTPTHSYNLGLGGMGALERDYVIDQLIKRCPHLRLRLAVIELQPSFIKFPDAFHNTVRELHWHDFIRTSQLCGEIVSFMCDKIQHTKNGWSQALALVPDLGEHITLCLRRFTNTGRITELLKTAPNPKKIPMMLREAAMGRDGFAPIARTIPDAEFAVFMKTYANRAKDLRGKPPIDPGTARMLAKIRRTGAAVCFFISPNSQGTHPALIADVKKNNAPVLAYDDLSKYPQFYEQDHRSDDLHMNRVGDEIFSHTLADDVAGLVKSGTLKTAETASDYALR